jgi:hypothetical protein
MATLSSMWILARGRFARGSIDVHSLRGNRVVKTSLLSQTINRSSDSRAVALESIILRRYVWLTASSTHVTKGRWQRERSKKGQGGGSEVHILLQKKGLRLVVRR